MAVIFNFASKAPRLQAKQNWSVESNRKFHCCDLPKMCPEMANNPSKCMCRFKSQCRLELRLICYDGMEIWILIKSFQRLICASNFGICITVAIAFIHSNLTNFHKIGLYKHCQWCIWRMKTFIEMKQSRYIWNDVVHKWQQSQSSDWFCEIVVIYFVPLRW